MTLIYDMKYCVVFCHTAKCCFNVWFGFLNEHVGIFKSLAKDA